MEELPGIIIAIVVIFFIARYFSGQSFGTLHAQVVNSSMHVQDRSKRVKLSLSGPMASPLTDLFEAFQPQW